MFWGIGGSRKLLGPTGGYRYGFAAAAILTSLFCRKVKNLKAQTAFLVFAGIPVIYLFGAVQMKAVTKQPWQAIMVQAVLPFIPTGCCKVFCGSRYWKDPAPCCAAVLGYVNRENVHGKVWILGGMRSFIGVKDRMYRNVPAEVLGSGGAQGCH